MRAITPELTNELERHVGKASVDQADALPVTSYRELVQHIAHLAHLNKDHLLFFRGQTKDYRNKAGSSTIYPSIYRGDYIPHGELVHRFQILEEACRQLSNQFEQRQITGYRELVRKTYIQWSILQHYEVCDTPLLDLTHSIPVACSFAQRFNSSNFAYIFIFGLPYITNRIAINSEHDLVNVRLLSISPPDALRPYFQEGYLAGTTDVTTEFPSKTELDFRNRLVAKFCIPTGHSFWGNDFSSIPEELLYPENDLVGAICSAIAVDVRQEILPGDLGHFISTWSELERLLVEWARQYEDRVNSVTTALSALLRAEVLDPQMSELLHDLRKFRNVLVHEPKRIEPGKIPEREIQAREAIQYVRRQKG